MTVSNLDRYFHCTLIYTVLSIYTDNKKNPYLSSLDQIMFLYCVYVSSITFKYLIYKLRCKTAWCRRRAHSMGTRLHYPSYQIPACPFNKKSMHFNINQRQYLLCQTSTWVKLRIVEGLSVYIS